MAYNFPTNFGRTASADPRPRGARASVTNTTKGFSTTRTNSMHGSFGGGRSSHSLLKNLTTTQGGALGPHSNNPSSKAAPGRARRGHRSYGYGAHRLRHGG